MNLSESMEMYLETIFLLEKKHGHAHVVDIAENLAVTKPSVTKATDQLQKESFLNKESYGHITLTKKGEDIAKKIYKKHCLIACFLEKTLGLDVEDASVNACRMEHIITDTMIKSIEKYLDE